MKLHISLSTDAADQLQQLQTVENRDYKEDLLLLVDTIRKIMRVFAKNRTNVTAKQLSNILNNKIFEPVLDVHSYMEEREEPFEEELYEKLVKTMTQTTHSARIMDNLVDGKLTPRQVSWVLNSLRRLYKFINQIVEVLEK